VTRALEFSRPDLRLDGADDLLGNAILQIEDVLQLTVYAVRPDMVILFGIEEFRRDPHALARATDASLEDVAHTKLLTQVTRWPRAVHEAGTSRENEEPSDARQGCDEFIHDAIGEVGMICTVTNVLERKHGKGRPPLRSWARRSGGWCGTNALARVGWCCWHGYGGGITAMGCLNLAQESGRFGGWGHLQLAAQEVGALLILLASASEASRSHIGPHERSVPCLREAVESHQALRSPDGMDMVTGVALPLGQLLEDVTHQLMVPHPLHTRPLIEFRRNGRHVRQELAPVEFGGFCEVMLCTDPHELVEVPGVDGGVDRQTEVAAVCVQVSKCIGGYALPDGQQRRSEALSRQGCLSLGP
jgi:hypothetical protein